MGRVVCQVVPATFRRIWRARGVQFGVYVEVFGQVTGANLDDRVRRGVGVFIFGRINRSFAVYRVRLSGTVKEVFDAQRRCIFLSQFFDCANVD